MALSSFLNVNGYDFPCPRRGFSWTISTTVNAGRNANNAVIGQRVGRDLYKLDNMEWVGLSPTVRKRIGHKLKSDVESYQKQIDEQEKEISALKLRLECEKADLSKAKKDLDDIPAYADISDNADYIKAQETIRSLEAQIEELRKETPDNTDAEARRDAIRDEISDIEAQIKAADNTKVKERIAELEEEQKQIGQKIAEQEQMIDLTEGFIRAKMNMISEKINEKFKVVRFSLFENQINGGLKETCECTVNGVPYSSLNNGHRIIAGLDIIWAVQI